MRNSLYRFMKKGTKELAKKLMKAGFDGYQNGTGHIIFKHPVTNLKTTLPVNLNPNSRLNRNIEDTIEKSNKILKEMENDKSQL